MDQPDKIEQVAWSPDLDFCALNPNPADFGIIMEMARAKGGVPKLFRATGFVKTANQAIHNAMKQE